jgi:vesicle-associated membrane protein 7
MSAAVKQGDVVHFQYAVIIYDGSPLAECSVTDDPGIEVRQRVVAEVTKIDPSTTRAVGDFGQSRLFVLTGEKNVRYACIAHSSTSDANGFEFLETLLNRWMRITGADTTAPNPRFGQTDISTQLRSYNSTQYDKIAVIKDNLREAQIQTSENLALALERGEAIDTMSTKAETMLDSAVTFKREATHLKNQMRCEKYRWYFVGAGVIVLIILAIVWMACGLDFGKC